MRDFTSLENANNTNLVPFVQEASGFLDQVHQVVLRNSRANLYTLYFLLFFLRALVLLLSLVLVPPKVNNFANRGLGCRGNHYKVETLFPGNSECLTALENAELITISPNDSHISKSEHSLVDRGAWIGPRFSSK